MYATLKHLHVTAVVLSFALFFLRGLWMLAESPRLQQTWVRIVPHVIDTVLLISAVALTVILQQYPFVNGWLTAKVLALFVYIGLGMIAIRHGRRQRQRRLAWIGALLTFGYIVAVAVSHNPLPWLSGV